MMMPTMMTDQAENDVDRKMMTTMIVIEDGIKDGDPAGVARMITEMNLRDDGGTMMVATAEGVKVQSGIGIGRTTTALAATVGRKIAVVEIMTK